MKRLPAIALAGALVSAMSPGASQAQESSALIEFKSMLPEVALDLAQAAMANCVEGGYQVAVAVTDRFGQVQVVLRARYAGAHTAGTATAKAWTAASFRTATLALEAGIADGTLSQGLRDIPGALILGGGVPVESAGSIIGAVGVSGAPGPDLDENCARAGITAIADRLDF